jgi:thermitase
VHLRCRRLHLLASAELLRVALPALVTCVAPVAVAQARPPELPENSAKAAEKEAGTDYLIRFSDHSAEKLFLTHASIDLLKAPAPAPASATAATISEPQPDLKLEPLDFQNWVRVSLMPGTKPGTKPEAGSAARALAMRLQKIPGAVEIQPNYPIHLIDPIQGQQPSHWRNPTLSVALDNPPFPAPNLPPAQSGLDPLARLQWGMDDMGVLSGWKSATGQGVVVAIIDTGVDYTHEDLINSMWRNPGETGLDAGGRNRESNGIDDDANGYVDDVVGWDFADNDNQPYDLAYGPSEIVINGGNAGHGTHCAGTIAAQAFNGRGIAGVAPSAKIMALRFLNIHGQGDTANAIRAIGYAVKMGARILSNSWGSPGDNGLGPIGNHALREAIAAAGNAGALFIAAAGNGHDGHGYDNDSAVQPIYPASFPLENIISVAAIDRFDQLSPFSNWGQKSVHLAAPGVGIYSTMVQNRYGDAVADGTGIKISWDGTSMAVPHVAGAAALYWSKHPQARWQEVKQAILASVKPILSMKDKSVSGGKLNVERLMSQ